MKLYAEVAEQYSDFAAYAADSRCFRDWASRAATDQALLGWIGRLPAIKQQPNLVFAAARWHGVPAPGPYENLREALLCDDGSIRDTILRRSTQTNEVGRLATLAPVFARIARKSGPLSLVEAGASAGLCLYPDRYRYRYEFVQPQRSELWPVGDGPILDARAKGAFSVPTHSFEVSWRGGIDLSPLDVDDDDAMAWLETLVWPEQHERRARLRQAVQIARQEPARIQRGDILTDLPSLIDQAAPHGQVVVFHSAVVAYLEPAARERFDELMRDLVAAGACRWVSNEGKNVLPSITRTGPSIPENHPTFVLGLDGVACAWTHGHGSSLRWLD
ncbi:DUF2332 domain-containing protein [Gephyromycinifex aptenodytis]|uniref:DUF2332 domain-containing protein n=1 Tax=Gephyromycinifex aptenodytis TaxID=2716227 RepID=UPI001445AC0E|nr:DUF2332 domain-containing protein [Gephyromycinifex aptenodytis]